MSLQSLFRLLLLSALWGGTFLLMRIATPILGPSFTVEARVLTAAIFLLFVSIYLKKEINCLKSYKHFLILGLFNSALPSFLFSYASLSLSASELSILNATSPVFGFIIGVLIGNEKINFKRVLGLFIGIFGVVVLFSDSDFSQNTNSALSILCGLFAAFCYGVATNYAKKSITVEPLLNAYGSMVFSSIIIFPSLFFVLPTSEPTPEVILAVLALGVLCSGIAYLLYFRLIKDVGATTALTVTFLIPIFSAFWGYLFLGETITQNIVFGMSIVLIGTGLVSGFDFLSFIKNKR